MPLRICDVPLLNRLCYCEQKVATPIVETPKKTEVEACHHPSKACHKAATPNRDLINIMNQVTRIALAIIAVMTSATLFFPVFFIGMALGWYHHHYSPSVEQGHGPEILGCGQGFMESMADMHFPAEISLLANLGVTICHIDHHPLVFVPYAALAVGMWAGQLIDTPITKAINWMRASHGSIVLPV